jgi:hypothetical protein
VLQTDIKLQTVKKWMHDKANPKPFVPSISIYFLQEYPINILIPFRGSGLPEDVGWDLG